MVFKIIIPIFLLLSFAFAEQIEINANNILADEKKLISVLKGNVVIKKGKFDTLASDSAKIYFDKSRQPIKYVANGNVKFQISINSKKYSGSSNSLIYDPQNDLYILDGNVFLQDLSKDKKVYAQEIIINRKLGTYEIKSKENTPVKLIFQIKGAK